MPGYVYILKSLNTGRFYIGSTNDIHRRIIEHQSGKTTYVSRYIKPFQIVFIQEYEDETNQD
jgi:putative endonuclease